MIFTQPTVREIRVEYRSNIHLKKLKQTIETILHKHVDGFPGDVRLQHFLQYCEKNPCPRDVHIKRASQLGIVPPGVSLLGDDVTVDQFVRSFINVITQYCSSNFEKLCYDISLQKIVEGDEYTLFSRKEWYILEIYLQ